MKIEVGEVLRRLEDTTYVLIERAMRDGGTVGDVATAAAAVHATSDMRRKLGASSPKHDDIRAEYLTGLSLRLMEIDGGKDLSETRAAAALISRTPIAGGADEE